MHYIFQFFLHLKKVFKETSKKRFLVCIGIMVMVRANTRMGENRKDFVSASAGGMEIFLNV